MADKQATGGAKKKNTRKKQLARFSHLYESRDKKLCVFEDGHGHLTSVRASRLA